MTALLVGECQRALSSQTSQTHSLSLEVKPLWKAWHD